jgi:hypothetical protein
MCLSSYRLPVLDMVLCWSKVQKWASVLKDLEQQCGQAKADDSDYDR